MLQTVTAYIDDNGGVSPCKTPIDGMLFMRTAVGATAPRLFQPSLCITLQGAKRSTFGDRHFVYGAGQALIVGIEMPAVSSIAQASTHEPYVGIVLALDLKLMREVLLLLPRRLTDADAAFAACVVPFDAELADCVSRLIRLTRTPEAIPIVSPLILREISYRLLTGAGGDAFLPFLVAGNRSVKLLEAVSRLRERHCETVRVEELAEIANMSASVFHREFKMLTSMTPLQFQKQLRLLAARNLMLSGGMNAETAAYRVGYESPSHFNREYARLFGEPPHRDAAARKAALVGVP